MPKKYDFAGWVTKNDTLCSDGVVIKHDAFKGNDQTKVPLVWEHDHNSPENVLGYMILHNQKEGVYGYGFFNDSPQAEVSKQLLAHGDISSMSIAANKIKKVGSDVVHGRIFEVSLVLAGANPGALIDEVMSHSDGHGGEEIEAIIYTPNLIHSAGDVIADPNFNEGGNTVDGNEQNPAPEAKPEVKPESGEEKTIGEVLDTLSEEQKDAVEALLAGAVEQVEGKSKPEDKEDEGPKPNPDGGEEMKHNVFEGKEANEAEGVLTHSERQAILDDAKAGKGTLKEVALQHSITNIELLFPDVKATTDKPIIFGPINTEAKEILAGVRKSPFSRIKTVVADMTEDEARAKGYIKGKEKLEQVFKLLKRETYPQTVYKKQKLDRDDIIDITDFDIVPFINQEMREMLDEELARAILVGDGRSDSAEDKIKEDKIRPILKEDPFYAIPVKYANAEGFLETVIRNKKDLRGSGKPTMYINPDLYADVKLLKGTDGRFLYGDIPTDEAMAQRFGVAKITETTLLPAGAAVIVNLSDYQLGASKGGEITTFDDFDIDFNQYKYLIETRVSGALVLPKAAMVLTQGTSGTTTTTTTTTAG